MDLLDLELYSDRLARHGERLADDLAAARLRLAWADFEREARPRLVSDDSACLEAVGVLGVAGGGDDDRALIRRRRRQLDALARLQALVEEALAAERVSRPGADRRAGDAGPGS